MIGSSRPAPQRAGKDQVEAPHGGGGSPPQGRTRPGAGWLMAYAAGQPGYARYSTQVGSGPMCYSPLAIGYRLSANQGGTAEAPSSLDEGLFSWEVQRTLEVRCTSGLT